MTEETLKVTDVKEILSAVYLKRISTKLDGVITGLDELKRIVAPPLYRFMGSEKYKHKEIGAKKNDLVFQMIIPKDQVAIITEVANSWFANTYYVWIVDSSIEKVERQIAPIDTPKVFEKGMVVFNKIEWEAYNDDSASHVFEVVTDGYYINRNLYRKIVGI